MADIERPNFCSRCGHAIVVREASFCKECGVALTATVLLDQIAWNPATAFALSLIPGLGHWYKGQRRRGLVWLATVFLFYAIAWPLGFTLHLICATNAAFGGALREDWLPGRRRRRRKPSRMNLAASTPR